MSIPAAAQRRNTGKCPATNARTASATNVTASPTETLTIDWQGVSLLLSSSVEIPLRVRRLVPLLLCCTVLGCREGSGSGNAVTALSFDNHPPFPIAEGTHSVDCNTCHGSFDTFSEFTCLEGCHDEAETTSNHDSVGGFVYDSIYCYDCHWDGLAGDNVDHTKIFPIDSASDHGGLFCRNCHRDSVRSNVTCAAECHPKAAMANTHTDVGGYGWSSPTCLRCHADSQVDPVALHLPFVIQRGKHYRKSCLACHPNARLDKPFGNDFSTFSCGGSGCHSKNEMDDTHKSMPAYVWQPPSCLQSGCHPDGRVR